MAVPVFFKILILSLCLSQIILGTSAGIATTSVEVFKKFFIAAQEFKKAVVAAGGVEKLKQDPKFKEVPPQIMDVVYGAGKALEDLPNPDLAARGFWSSAKGVVEKGKEAWEGVKSICKSIVGLEDATVKP